MIINVMLVDDEAPSREYIRGLIDWEANGFCLVAEAQNVEEALVHLASRPIQLVLMDVNMPGRNGVDLSREIASRYSHVMMIAVSSYDNYDYVREILINGAHDYVLKHRLDTDHLLRLLQAVRQKLSLQDNQPDEQRNLRSRASDWLFGGQPCPFLRQNGRLILSVARLATDGSRLESPSMDGGFALQEALRAGVQKIIESSVTSDEQTAWAVYSPLRYFVICTCVAGVVSEAKLQNAVNLNNIRAANSIRLLYKTDTHFVLCPIDCPPDRLPAQVQTLLSGEWEQKTMSSSLSITAKKQLLTALEQHNLHQTEQTIRDIFAVQLDSTSLLLLAHELTTLFDTAAQEYGVRLPALTPIEQQLLHTPRQDTASQLCNLFCERFAQVISTTASATSQHSQNVCNANSFIEKFYSSSISLNNIAKEIGVSPSYLSRLYRQETGMTVVDYLTRVRVDAAKRHIAGGAPLKEVAFVCGFSSYNYFFKVFKDYEGLTPKEYAQQTGER